MKTQTLFQYYAVVTSSFVGMLGGFSRYDFFWSIFSIGGMFIMIGHAIFDQKIKYSAGRILWMIVSSSVACLVVKLLYDEKMISLMSMIIATLISSMIAPAVLSVVLKDLPGKVSEQILELPKILIDVLKNKVGANNKNNTDEQ